MKSTGILNAEVGAVPFAVIDFETTGLNPGADRVVEVSVLRVDPGDQANAVLDTLVNPCRPMAASRLLSIGLATARKQGIRTFRDLARLKNNRFFQSFANEPLHGARTSPSSPGRLKSRSLGAEDTPAAGVATQAPVDGGRKKTRSAMHSYWNELKTVIADLEVTDDEVLHEAKSPSQKGP